VVVYDEEFLALVRLHMGPTLSDAGFEFNEVSLGSAPRGTPLVSDLRSNWLSRLLRRGDARPPMTTTTILYEADAQEFAERFPGSRERPTEPNCKDLWFHYEPFTGALDLDLQGERVDLGGVAEVVRDVSRSLQERVVALSHGLENSLSALRTKH